LKLYSPTILKEVIDTLDIASANCEIVTVDRADAVEQAIEALYASDFIGFDTETRPSFQRGELHTVSLLQLASGTHCYLFRLQKIGQNAAIKKLLEDKTTLKIGLSVFDDFRALNRWMPIYPTNFIELQHYVQAYGIEEKSLQKIFAIVCGKKISKRQQLSNWEAPKLTPSQRLYAATDAWACRQIYLELRQQI
jgi:ribonuclease D